MLIFKTIHHLQEYLSAQKAVGKTIGFAPTMGALHEGHASLITLAHQECSISVCSIFVNPTQFNDPKDLEKYPRTTEKDIELLLKQDCYVLFLPEVNEIYPPQQDITQLFDFGQLATVMEGEFRPGHFNGMAQVVKRLLEIVQPDALFMGQKDFQQFSIVANMLRQMQSPIRLVMAPTIREADGLAMSSRNVRLSPENRIAASQLYAILNRLKDSVLAGNSIQKAKQAAFEEMSNIPDFKPEYINVVDGYTLQPIHDNSQHDFVVACLACWAGAVRLIDNVVVKEDKPTTTALF